MRSRRTSLLMGATKVISIACVALTACSIGRSEGSSESKPPPPVVASNAVFPATASILDTDCHQAPATTAPGHYGGGHIVGCDFAPPATTTPSPDADHGVLTGHIRDDAGRPLPSLVDVLGPNVAIATTQEGSYGASFPPGEYIIEVVANADVGYLCGRHTVTIVTRHATQVDVTCTSPNR